MRKQPGPRWIKQHTIAISEKGPIYSTSGLVAVVEGDEAGIVGFFIESYYGVEEGIDLTKMPLPHEVLELDEWADWTQYIGRKEYTDHPKVVGFKPEINWLWEGSAAELFHAAKNNTDLMFPDRPLSKEDVDYEEMLELYSRVRSYLAKQNRKQSKKRSRMRRS